MFGANRKDDKIRIGFIDKMGKMVIDDSRYEYASDFNNGYACVVSKDKLFGIIDKMGKEIVPCKYTLVMAFHDGLAPVRNADLLWGFVNKEGVEVIP